MLELAARLTAPQLQREKGGKESTAANFKMKLTVRGCKEMTVRMCVVTEVADSVSPSMTEQSDEEKEKRESGWAGKK